MRDTAQRIARWGGAAAGGVVGAVAAHLVGGTPSLAVVVAVGAVVSALTGATFELLDGGRSASAEPVAAVEREEGVAQREWWKANAPLPPGATALRAERVTSEPGRLLRARHDVAAQRSDGDRASRPTAPANTLLVERPPPGPVTDGLATYLPAVRPPQCPRCGSLDLVVGAALPTFAFTCKLCRHRWQWAAGTPWPAVRINPRVRS